MGEVCMEVGCLSRSLWIATFRYGEAALNAKATGQPFVLKYILNNMP